MSSEWELTTVGAVSKVVTKGTTPTTIGHAFQASGVNFVKVEAISDDGQFLKDKFVAISAAAHEALARSQLQSDDVLFTIAGTIGRTAVVSGDLLPANTNQAVAIVRPNISKVRPRFLRFVLSNPAFRRLALSRTVESVQANFSLGELKSASIRVPPLQEQDAIVRVLGSLDDRITLLRETNATLEAIAQALFKSWFVDFDPVRAKQEGRAPEGMDEATAALFPESFEDSELGEVPRGWRPCRLADATEAIFSGGTPDTRRPDFWGGRIPWFSSGETRNMVITETEKAITAAGVQGSSTRPAKPGDILIASAGQGHTRGQTSICALDCFINQSVVAVRASAESSAGWLFFNLRRRYEEMRGLSDSHSSRGSLTTKLLASMPLVVPPASLIQAFDHVAAPVIESLASNQRQATTLSTLRDTLLPRLISGQLRLPEATEAVEEALS